VPLLVEMPLASKMVAVMLLMTTVKKRMATMTSMTLKVLEWKEDVDL